MENTIIFKDYREKIINKIYGNVDKQETAENINNIVNFLNYCFNKKNNFFISNFNKKSVFQVVETYNLLKTNILSKSEVYEDSKDFLANIKPENKKTLKFIFNYYVSNYKLIANDINSQELTNQITDFNVKKIIEFI